MVPEPSEAGLVVGCVFTISCQRLSQNGSYSGRFAVSVGITSW